VTHHLNKIGKGRVVITWNGLFFQYNGDIASHVAPVTLNSKARYNVGIVLSGDDNIRLTFSPDFKGALFGRSMMYFFVRDTSR